MNKILSFILFCASLSFALTMSPVTKASKPAELEGYEYGTATVYYNGMYYRFYCSYGLNSDPYMPHPKKSVLNDAWDYIRMRTSRDGSTWSAARVVLVPSVNNKENCSCDPAIIHGDDGYWYLYYTGFQKAYSTVTYVARSLDIAGPYLERYTEAGEWVEYPADPKILFRTKDEVEGEVVYGAGQSSVVKTKDGKYHFWFTDVSYAPPPVTPDKKYWKFVHVVTDAPYGDFQDSLRTTVSLDGETNLTMNDFGDVKWNDEEGQFEMWITHTHFYMSNLVSVMRYVSKDGNAWTSTGDSLGPFAIANNVGMSGDENGWMVDGKTIVAFGAPDEGLDIPDEKVGKMWLDIAEAAEKGEPHPPVAGLPWSTYQFVVGEFEAGKVSIPNSGYDCIAYDGDNCGMNMHHYQFSFEKFGRDKDALKFIVGDFDGDAISDIGVVDCSDDEAENEKERGCRWYIRSSKTGEFDVPKISGGWLWEGMNRKHTIVLGDFDGDGKTDRAIVNEFDGTWYIFSSSLPGEDALSRVVEGDTLDIFGRAIPGMGEMTHPLTGDYDGDGISDIGSVECHVIKDSTYCYWRYLSSVTGKVEFATIPTKNEEPNTGLWGGMSAAHVILEGDYDGDGKTDPAIYDPIEGLWFMISSRTGNLLYDPNMDKVDLEGKKIYDEDNNVVKGRYVFGYQWGGPTFQPVVGDFNGDGIADRSMVLLDAPNDFKWFADINVHSPSFFGFTLENQFMKFEKYQLLVGDFDGDAISDCAVADVVNGKVYFYTSLFKGEPGEKDVYRIKYSGQNKKKNEPKKATPNKGTLFETSEKLPDSPMKKPTFSTRGLTLTISDVNTGSEVSAFNMIGQNVFNGKTKSSEMNITLPSKGMYIVRVGSRSSVVDVK